MGDVVNLKQFRKAKERAEKQKTASEKRAKHGRSKAEREHQRAKDEKQDATLRGHQRDIEDDDREPA
ncbi:MAG: DUF4169 family protein [Rhizobiales bacterium]|nr:DUF4169 family protein [Hyphomicrobiales bacterium]